MLRHALHAKIHRAHVTQCNLDYVGSITIDQELLDAVGMRVNEKVLVADCVTGKRWETYVFKGEPGSRIIGINGAAAHLTGVGNPVLILSFCMLTEEEMSTHHPKVIVCDQDNQIQQSIEYDPE